MNNTINKNKYKYFPKNKDELKKIIEREIEINGNNCNLNIIDTSRITDMSELFMYFKKFNGNISKWNVSNVITMRAMFYKSDFNKDISKWNVSNVTSMTWMFCDSNFNENISNWNVHNVTNMLYMFESSKFNNDISNWNINNVCNMHSMFLNSNFNQNISNWITTLNEKCDLKYFIKNKNIEINNYDDFKKYHRQMILNNLNF